MSSKEHKRIGRGNKREKVVQELLAQLSWYQVAEYCLRGYSKPIGIAEWETQITRSLPDDLKPSLPSIEEIERELEDGPER